ncbi:MAG: amino-acid N-acetyltransferase [Hydrogenophilales bacterium CG03_land_8_20_14_0_80_62_28]|nr:amino-acid N-acetyltransferase [Betaproteobacteria bacterium]OIO78612.1 MAG: amino-acid N-acetyltransferase [Hydrogenophilaceae bacterium CG1_02_62_390]PIV22708.1 MAG: amino-acid N-acetyltransferase [Hydrogenophilales bacterium CG03_land_8_20_14_0_80_62_28]PIW39086.1 MAG: amino-acid N-acetyltransferase [Hydrogenophilales bacterium CG15_BIG_FIL_POST_REV_8_21_14_020_62_31]PIW72784.1 MAG: amino-acid N-acetyltransferase [Hydrogenophilales bacterium CG12_big_fil_rev_8_21_14_0_65_61_21]PIX01377.1
MTLTKPADADMSGFVDWFRAAAPYIHAFRGKTFVLAFGGDAMLRDDFVDLVHDINLLNAIGVRLVLVHGVRPQVEERLNTSGEAQYVQGRRVTDGDTLEHVKDAVGSVRVDIESMLSIGLPNTPMAGAEIRVASGNYVTAQPAGVVDGIDLQFTGEVRKVAADAIQHRLDAGDIVLLSPIGYSPTGEVFNLTLEDVATSAAIALRADKLIFILDYGDTVDAKGRPINRLTASQAQRLVKDLPDGDMKLYLPHAAKACRNGVLRAHLISADVDGALLMELFTHEGVGAMVSRQSVESLRNAGIDDVGAILQLIEPLEQEGVLVHRPRELLEQEIERFFVAELDGRIIGCVALYPFPETQAGEMACLVVHPDFRDGGRGEALMNAVADSAREQGLKRLFVLTARTAHWFVERGFVVGTPDDLPATRKEMYNWQRRSKVFIKEL